MLPSSVLSKECRLCGVSDGPFVNIFGAMGLAGKIKILLPMLVIDEWDDLSHKTCYRCTAKVAEFHEFAEKCIVTQKNLFKKLGKKSAKCSERTKKTREDWEKTLAEKNISNDQYCDELVKKALESLSSFKGEDMVEEPETKKSKKMPLKDLKIVLTKFEKPPPAKEPQKEAPLKINLRNKSSKINQEPPPPIEKKDDIKPIEELSDNITFFDVTDVDSIYSCKTCSKIFIQKDKIKNHKCSQADISDKDKSGKEQASQKATPSTSKINMLPMPTVLNNTQQLPYLVKTLDNNLIVLPPNYLQCNQNVLNMLPQNVFNLNATILKTTKEVPSNLEEEEDLSISVLSEKMKSVKNNLKNDKKTEPYPVGLLYRKSHENGELGTSKCAPVKEKITVEVDKNKKYKIKPNDQPGKIIIATVDMKESLEEEMPLVNKRISHKKQKKNHKKRCNPVEHKIETVNDTTKPNENGDYFTFLNIDPIAFADPSYVLPTTNTVQESQVSTTDINTRLDKLKKKAKNKQSNEQNTCNICDLVFNDISLFINHIQTHFDDPPQQSSAPVEVKRRGRKRKNPI